MSNITKILSFLIAFNPYLFAKDVDNVDTTLPKTLPQIMKLQYQSSEGDTQGNFVEFSLTLEVANGQTEVLDIDFYHRTLFNNVYETPVENKQFHSVQFGEFISVSFVVYDLTEKVIIPKVRVITFHTASQTAIRHSVLFPFKNVVPHKLTSVELSALDQYDLKFKHVYANLEAQHKESLESQENPDQFLSTLARQTMRDQGYQEVFQTMELKLFIKNLKFYPARKMTFDQQLDDLENVLNRYRESVNRIETEFKTLLEDPRVD